MLKVEHLTYAAIVTITLPEAAGRATATLTLLPQDAIPTTSGRVKALRDCTLRELEEFAEALESEVWATLGSRPLGELAADEQAQVKITILDESGEALAIPDEEWLSHVVLLADGMASEEAPAAAEAEPEPAAQEPAATVESDLPGEAEEVAEAEEPEEAPAEPAAVPEPEAETAETAEAETAAEAAPGAMPESAAPEVAEPAPSVAPPVETPPGVRIAGRRRPLGHKTPAAVDILINEPAFRDAQAHAVSSMDREVAGVLVGPRPEKQPDGRYVVHVTDIIIAKYTRMHGASVTYTPDSWRHIHDRLAERYPNEEAVIVGWYHTHPGFGIFLSGMDLFIHQNFFTQIWHVALVLDPVACKSGFFCWNRRQSAVERYDFPWPHWAVRSW